jgi:5S rRNA maturation endonuclease (ribonuclease M5)
MITITASSVRLMLTDLGGIEAGKYGGGNRRYYCPIHGGDHQRSLSVIDSGEGAGIAHCHAGGCEGNTKTVIILDYPGRDPNYRPPRPRSPDVVAREWMTVPVKQPEKKALKKWQQKELDFISGLWSAGRPQKRIGDDRAQAYLSARGLSSSIVDLAEVGYIPDVSTIKETWQDRLLFPLWSPEGIGFIGRAMWRWYPGMDEREHKAILDTYDDELKAQGKENNPRARWHKTAIAGWYGAAPVDLADTIFIVEGALDRLSIIASGIQPNEVIALAGTSINVEWLPRHLERVIIALDNDEAGQQKSIALARYMRAYGITVLIATAPNDGQGKDSSERFRLTGSDGIEYLVNAWIEITSM